MTKRIGANGDAKRGFSEVTVTKQCPKNFTYVAIVVERDVLGFIPTKVVYGKTYPSIGINVPEGRCAVLIGKNAAEKLSLGNGGFVAVAPEDIIILQGQTQWSDRNIGQFANVKPGLVTAGAYHRVKKVDQCN